MGTARWAGNLLPIMVSDSLLQRFPFVPEAEKTGDMAMSLSSLDEEFLGCKRQGPHSFV
jgi:hypothetical protein